MNKEVELFGMTKRERVIYLILFLLYLETNNASINCTWSTRNLELVTHCPVTFEEREDAAFIKNCKALSVIQTCSKPLQFKYHCVASKKEYVFMEVCAPEVEIRSGFCATFNPQTGQLESHAVKQCVNTTRPCPERYVSSDSYLYPFCYGFNDITFIKEISTASSAEVYDFRWQERKSKYCHPIIIAVMGSSIVVSFFLGIVCRLCCRKLRILCCRKKRKRGNKREIQETIRRRRKYETEGAFDIELYTERRQNEPDEGPERVSLRSESYIRRRLNEPDEGPNEEDEEPERASHLGPNTSRNIRRAESEGDIEI